MSELDDVEYDAIWLLRRKGWAIAAFSPFELNGSDPDAVSEQMLSAGQESIQFFAENTFLEEK